MINMISPFNCTSYGYTGCYLLQELARTTKVAAIPISNVVAEPKFANYLKPALDTPFFYDAPCLKLWHQHDLSGFVGRGRHVGFTIFELDDFSDKEKHSLGYPDHVATCSEWARQVIINQTTRTEENTHVVPLGIDKSIFKPCASRITDRTIFLNAGKWEYRKGHDILLEAFNLAFEQDDQVELWMMPHNFFLSEAETNEWVQFYKNSKLGNKIQIFPRVAEHETAYKIMADAHCGVFPSRAEGWNLELLEMMSIGKHVITTDYSAHTEYANEDNSHLISVSERELAFDGKFFDGKGGWAALGGSQVDQLVSHMRDVHTQHIHGELPVNQDGINTGNSFTWQHASEILLGVLND